MRHLNSYLLAVGVFLFAAADKITAFQSPSPLPLTMAHQHFNRNPTIETEPILLPSPVVVTAGATPSPAKQEHRRRDILQAASACLILMLTRPKEALAHPKEQKESPNISTEGIHLQIKTKFPKDFSPGDFGPESRLLITVKPAVTYTDQVPRHVADASMEKTGHWVPDVLQYKESCSSLLLASCDNDASSVTPTSSSVTLTNEHMTPEGAAADSLWWKTLPLVVTVKLDSDGNPGTIGPKDLVGCKILLLHANDLVHNGVVTLPLQKRGICSDLFSSNDTVTT